MHRRAIACSLLLLLFTSACTEECVEEACSEANQPQAQGSLAQGIVGVVAYRTDACANDCCECSYSDATLLIFEVQSAVADEEDAQARFMNVEPTVTLQAHERYAQALEPGRYAVCDQRLQTCANIEIAAGEVMTLNVQAIYGPTLMRVFDADGARRAELVVGAGAPY